jgi:heterodisulfide reductase subunit A
MTHAHDVAVAPAAGVAPEMLSLSINGQTLGVARGTSLLEAAERLGIRIPKLCHHPALLPYGACRLCLVEVEPAGRPATIQASCCYPALPGLVVKTDTPRVQNARKIVAELLLARCPDSPVIQKLGRDLGVGKPRVKAKNDDCIYCGLCVRICEQRMGRASIGVSGRGPRRKVEPPYGKHNAACWTCGACISVCPTDRLDFSMLTANSPVPIPYEYNMGLDSRPAIHIPYPQAIPNKPVIDPTACVHLLHDQCGVCEAVCQAGAIRYDQQEETLELTAGAVILAPGYEVFDAAQKPQLGYGRFPNVITALEFERILSASGPFGSKVVRPSDHRPPKRIAFIQCVGSREHDRDYCSAVCCMYATKEALIAKEHAGADLECDIFFMDLRAFGKGFEAYYQRAVQDGVRYIRCRPASVEEVPGTGNLRIEYLGPNDRKQTAEYDLVVLSTGLAPPKGARELAERLGIQLNELGFCSTGTFAGGRFPGAFAAGVREAHADQSPGRGPRARRHGRGAPDRGLRVPLRHQHRWGGRRPGRGRVCEDAARGGVRGEQPLHLLERHAGAHQGEGEGARPQSGGGRLLLPPDPRAALPEHLPGGRAERVPLRDGQHP